MATFIQSHVTSLQKVDMSIEQLLSELSKFAFVDIFNSDMNDTWSASACMRIKTKGATFKVHSGHGHASAKIALSTLLELVESTVKELGTTHITGNRNG